MPSDHVGVDVRDQGAVRDAVAQVGDLGPLAYAVNCAGVDGLVPSAGMNAEEWNRVLDVDLDGVMYACQAEHELMADRGGSIVNIASMSRAHRQPGGHPRCVRSGQGGRHPPEQGARGRVGPAGIRVNSVSPGYTLTEMTRLNPPEVNAGFASQTPLGRLAEVEEVAEPVVFLLGERASFVTGTDLLVDGGFCAW